MTIIIDGDYRLVLQWQKNEVELSPEGKVQSKQLTEEYNYCT